MFLTKVCGVWIREELAAHKKETRHLKNRDKENISPYIRFGSTGFDSDYLACTFVYTAPT